MATLIIYAEWYEPRNGEFTVLHQEYVPRELALWGKNWDRWGVERERVNNMEEDPRVPGLLWQLKQLFNENPDINWLGMTTIPNECPPHPITSYSRDGELHTKYGYGSSVVFIRVTDVATGTLLYNAFPCHESL